VPSSGGGTKLRRTFLAGAEGVCSGVGEGVVDSSGVGEELGVGASCPIAGQIEANAITIATLSFFVMSSGVEKTFVGAEEVEET